MSDSVQDWSARLDQITALDAQIATMKAMLAELVAEVVEPKRAAIRELEAARAQLKQELDIAAVASVERGAPKTFGGVQVRRTRTLDVLDEAQAIAVLRGREWRGKPLVKEQLDPVAVAAYLKATCAEDDIAVGRQLLPGLRLAPGWSVAILRQAAVDERTDERRSDRP